MTFHCIYGDLYEGVSLRIEQFREASKKLGIDFNPIDSTRFDYSKIPKLAEKDLLYNCARGSYNLESLLINDSVTTFYTQNPAVIQTKSTTDWTIIHEKGGLKSPKTIFNITSDRHLLKTYVEYLGGFPIIIKSEGSTRGIGTIKVDSWQSLISTVDYLLTIGHGFILREFIKAKSGGRLIVLGNEVIASAEFFMHDNDFRNAVLLSETKYTNKKYPIEVEEIAIMATKMANVEMSGVDFLENSLGEFFLLEANFPTGFSALIDICKVDIPYKMIEFLKNKASIN